MSHFSAVGFIIESNDDIGEIIEKILPYAEHRSTHDKLSYLSYTDPSGVQIWLCGNNDSREIVNVFPCFSPKTSQIFGMNAVTPIEQGQFGDGMACGWLNVSEYDKDDGWCDGIYPLTVELPNYLDYQADDKIRTAFLTLFAEDVDIFADVDAFNDWQKRDDNELGFSSEFFSPSGMFSDDEQDEPTAIVLAGLTVIEAEKRTNTITNREFYWCRASTYGGEYEAVFDLDMFDDVPKSGNVIFGNYWLTGQFE
ncbi:hypothetical protein [Moraxella sp. ZY200743]|uniref:hypothetical protein n=1 Tax=Moraxella sp. ZY200743 TaxID=2911970 RepID=UPI003D7C40E4